MAIVRISSPESLPTSTSDYQRQNTLTRMSFRTINDPYPIDFDNNVIPEGYIMQIGDSIYRVDMGDEAISGTPSDYVKVTPQGDGSTAIAEYVSDLVGVLWSNIYNHYEDGSGNLYLFDEGLAVINGDIASAHTRYALQKGVSGNFSVGGLLKSVGIIQAESDINAKSDIVLDGTNQELIVYKSETDKIYGSTSDGIPLYYREAGFKYFHFDREGSTTIDDVYQAVNSFVGVTSVGTAHISVLGSTVFFDSPALKIETIIRATVTSSRLTLVTHSGELLTYDSGDTTQLSSSSTRSLNFALFSPKFI